MPSHESGNAARNCQARYGKCANLTVEDVEGIPLQRHRQWQVCLREVVIKSIAHYVTLYGTNSLASES